MNDEKKKDALTDLVDVAGSSSGSTPNNGTVSTPSGDKVELDFRLQIRKLATRLTDAVWKRRKEEKEVLEQMVTKDRQKRYERETTN